MKSGRFILWVMGLLSWFLFSTCEKDEDKPTANSKLVLSKVSADSVSYFFATVSAEIENAKRNTILDHGFCYSSSPNPDINDKKMSLGRRTDDGAFNANITGLNDYKKYYIRAYASFEGGTLYAGQKDITTLKTGKPLIITTPLSNITPISAICGGEIKSDSGYAVSVSGICWDTDNQFNETQCLGKAINTSGNATFSLNITELTEGTTYFVKAYATNQKGNSYGEIRQFSSATYTIPTVTTNAVTDPGANSAVGGGNVTNDGFSAVTARGVCWNTTGNPSLQNCLGFTTDGQGEGSFTSNLTDLNPSATYFVRAYATNISGTAYGNQISFTTSAQVAVVVMNEIYSRGLPENPDWIEIYNTSTTISADISGYKIYDNGGQAGAMPKKEFPAGTVIQPGGFFVIVVDDVDASGFALASSGEQVWLENATGTVIDNITFPALAETESYGRYPDGSANLQILSVITPGAANDNSTPPPATVILMNEIYSRGIPENPDWIEIFNGSSMEVDISGFKIYDGGGQAGTKPKKEFPAGTVIQPGGFFVIVVDDVDASGFNLSSGGEQVWLENSIGTVIDNITFPAFETTQSYGRKPDGSANLFIFIEITRGASNNNAGTLPKLRR